MITYPKTLRKKDLKRISRYPCSEDIKEAYLKYLTNYSFEEFAGYCAESDGNMEEMIFAFTDLQLESFEPNSLAWISHVLVNFLIYFNVNLDYGNCYDAYASALQFSVLFLAMDVLIEKISIEEAEFPEHSKTCFERLFEKCTGFRYGLEKDCRLAYKSFNNDFGFTADEFYLKIKNHFDECGYEPGT